MKKTVFTISILLSVICTFGQIPQGYYNTATGLSGEQLQSALHNIIDGHNVESYSDLWSDFKQTDKKSNGYVWDMYSDIYGGNPPYNYTFFSDQCGNYGGEGDCYNREHSFPKSWFGGTVSPMYTDLFHLVPTDGYVNNKRSNYPYGEVGNVNWTSLNGSKVGSCNYPGYSGIVFEPIDEYKGDFARNYFYMATRYYQEDSNWPGSAMVNGAQPKPWALELLNDWHESDPVSPKEVNRNEAVYDIQNNRNPFIDHPEFANQIWFSSGIDYDFDTFKSKISVYPNPVSDICNISFSSSFNINYIEYSLTDLLGKPQETNFTICGQSIKINTLDLSQGIYFLKITDKSVGTEVVFKIVK